MDIHKKLPIFKFNLKDKIEDNASKIIEEALEQRTLENSLNPYNFSIKSQFQSLLYQQLFLACNKIFKNQPKIIDSNYKMWCHISDKTFNKTCWHNHITTSTINAVIYIQTVAGAGVDFKGFYFEPKPFDLIVFPNYLDHKPRTAKEKRQKISLNLELLCKEEAKNLFKHDNIKEKVNWKIDI